jgi:hypothetical protein
VKIRDASFAGEYVRNEATLVWSGENELGFMFHCDPRASGFAAVGHERNGVFFS